MFVPSFGILNSFVLNNYKTCISNRFTFICIAPSHNMDYPKALYRVWSKPLYRETKHAPQRQQVQGKMRFNRKRPPTLSGSHDGTYCK